MAHSKLKIWIKASRPKTLWAAVAPVIVGTAMSYADGKAHWLGAACAALGAVWIQIGTNFANDYFDYFKGVDKGERLGPTRATQAGLVSPQEMKRAFIIAYLIAAFCGIYLIYRGGWPIVLIGALSILFGITYTTGPFALAHLGLADLFVLIFFGLVAVGGTYYVQALEINSLVLMAGIAPGLFSTAILTVNNLRDIESDAKAGKKSLVVRFGAAFGRIEYVFCIAVACLVPVVAVLLTGAHFYSLTSSLVFFAAISSIRILYREKPGRIYNQILANTGKLLLLFSLLFSVGWNL